MRDPTYYRERAARFRELASDSDAETTQALLLLAEEYEAEARRLGPNREPPDLPAWFPSGPSVSGKN